MKKLTAIILVLMLAVSCFAGCGKKETSTDGKITLRIGLPGGDSITPLELIDEFKAANPDIEIITDEAPWADFRTKLDLQIGGKNEPDVYITDSGHATSLASKGVLMDLTGKIDEELNKEDYISSLLSLSDSDGKVWGVPHAINSTALFYNEELFDKAGLEYPTENWTWEDVLEAAKKLTGPKNKDGASDVYGFSMSSNMTLGWYPIVLATGGTPLDKTRTKSNFDDPKTIDGVNKFEEMAKSQISPPAAWASANGGKIPCFYQGKIAMTILQSSAVKTIVENAPDLRFNVTNIPYGWDGERNTIYVPNVWVISGRVSEEKQEAAWKWLRFYLSEASQLKLAEECRGGYPVHKKALEYLDAQEAVPSNRTVFYNELDTTGVTLSENPSWAEWKAEADAIFKDIYNGILTADEAVKKLHEKVSKALED